MKAEISFKYFYPSEKLIDFTKDKVERLVSSHPDISAVDVVLVFSKDRKERPRRCKICVTVQSRDIVVERNADTFEASILEVAGVVARELQRFTQTRG